MSLRTTDKKKNVRMTTRRRSAPARGGRNVAGEIKAYMTPSPQPPIRGDNIGGAAGQNQTRYGSPEIGRQHGRTGQASPIPLYNARRQDPQSRNPPVGGGVSRKPAVEGRDGNSNREGEPVDSEWGGCLQDPKEMKES